MVRGVGVDSASVFKVNGRSARLLSTRGWSSLVTVFTLMVGGFLPVYAQWDFDGDGSAEVMTYSTRNDGGLDYQAFNLQGEVVRSFPISNSDRSNVLFFGAFERSRTIQALTVANEGDRLRVSLQALDGFPLTRIISLRNNFHLLPPDDLAGRKLDDLVLTYTENGIRFWRVLRDPFGGKNGGAFRIQFGRNTDAPFLWRRRGGRTKLAVLQNRGRTVGPVVIRVRSVNGTMERVLRLDRRAVSSFDPYRVPIIEERRTIAEGLAFMTFDVSGTRVNLLSPRGYFYKRWSFPSSVGLLFGSFTTGEGESQFAYQAWGPSSIEIESFEPQSGKNSTLQLKASFGVPNAAKIYRSPSRIFCLARQG